MAGCCNLSGYRSVFSPGRASREAQDYRDRGLEATERAWVQFLKARGLEGLTVLEVGGGVGAIQVELLRAGAARAVNVEIVPTYEAAAQQLVAEWGLHERMERHVMDFARDSAQLPPEDVVIMHRVICCYPDMELLMRAAADHTRRYLLLSYPRDNLAVRLFIAAENLWHRLLRRDFRAYLHPPSAILEAARSHGLRLTLKDQGLIWESATLDRPTPEPEP